MKIGIYIFRRDLRLEDNMNLYNLAIEVDLIIPIFILDKYQIKKSSHNINYFSSNAVQFMAKSLIDLSNQLSEYDSKLWLFYGNPLKIIKKLIKSIKKKYNVRQITVAYAKDYSKYALKRDKQIDDYLINNNHLIIKTSDDYTLINLNLLTKSDNVGYKQFGAFYKNATKHSVNKSIRIEQHIQNIFLSKQTKFDFEYPIDNLSKFYIQNDMIAQIGGRSNALIILENIRNFSTYNDNRDTLSYSTTNLSAYLNFGCVSCREVYHTIRARLGINSLILKQLYWRDFYLQALIYLKNGNEYIHMDERYASIRWKNSKEDWQQLINCKTGFLIVDAAMNEMINTGYMHNRARMIVGVFWTKYLLIDIFHPTYGSQVGFSKYLVDAIGPSQNKLNHQWITEFDYAGKKYAPSDAPIAGRPMDISNRMIAKWDPTCAYIKKWLKHLNDIPNKELYKWNEQISTKYNNIHPAPMFDSKLKYKEWINACK